MPFQRPTFPKPWNDYFQSLEEAILANRPLDGFGIRYTDSKNGRIGNVDFPSSSGGAGNGLFPFKVLLRKFGEQWKRIVLNNSRLFDMIGEGLDPVEINITGCAATDSPVASDPGWANTEDGDRIWLELVIGVWPAVATASIRSTEAGDEWDGGEVEHDGGDGGTPEIFIQTKARLVIAVVEVSGTILRTVQYVTTHRLLGVSPADGRDAAGGDPQPVAAVFPFPL